MFLELAEALDCPRCRSACGLVAFVDESTDRRVVSGRLGCPLCEVEFPIRAGAIDFGGTWSGESAVGSPPVPSDTALRIGALLNVQSGTGMVILLGHGLAIAAAEVARMGERIEVLSLVEPSHSSPMEELAAGVDPMRGVSPESWPIRSGGLDGIALLGAIAGPLAEAQRCARSGARLAVLRPGASDLERLAESEFREVAADELTWLGERL